MASWDPYLSDRDRAHLEAGYLKKAPFGFGTNPVCLVIDDYYSVLGTEREPFFESIKKWPMSTGLEGWAAIDRTVDLLRAARANDVPVIYVHGMEKGFVPWGRRSKAERLAHLSPEERAKANQIVDEIAPLPGELVIQKAAASAFQGTPLVFHLNYHGVDTVIACGETTSGCVRASVVDGATYRFAMGVVEECCFDRTEASHYINLFDMNQKYADVVSLGEAVSYFDGIGAKKGLLAGALA
ncbi:MAG: isochorismatase family protein [Dehalococcoidia bacterium]|nr:isochorismatase family protein [Dehalococcoidia bacterium]